MINIQSYDEGLPISVIVPHVSRRDDFFNNYCLPSINACEPLEVIVVTDMGSAPKQRNIGLENASQPLIIWIDDDVILPQNYLSTLHDAIKNYDVAYTGYMGIVLDPSTEPNHNFRIPTIDFDYERLRSSNYISTMSLIRKSMAIKFDERLKRLQDWDLYLRMYKNGSTFIGVHNTYFMACFFDKGLSSNNNISYQEALRIIKQKHKL
jgi:glycosyltransferase involved in cell wall biosynthesis